MRENILLYNSLRYFLLMILLLVFGVSAMAQTKSDSTSDDLFKNDPFFSNSMDDFFNGDSTINDRDHKAFVKDLNQEGLDYRNVFEAGPYNTNALYSVFPNLPMIHYNRVDELFLGIKRERMQWYPYQEFLDIPNIQLHGMIGYSTGQKNWQYTVGMEKLLGRDKHMLMGFEFHNATSTDDYWRVGLTETTFTSLLAGYDYMDYYGQKGWGMYLLFRTNRLFEGGIAFNDDRYSSLSRETNWALFGAGGRYSMNPPVDLIGGSTISDVDISALTLSASYNPKKLVLDRNIMFSISAMAEFADLGIGTSEYSYSKYGAELISFLNFEPGGIIKYRLKASGITGESPLLKQLYLGGIGTLRALPFKSLGGGNQMLLSNLELQFGQPLLHSGDWIDFDDFYISLFLDSGWVEYDPEMTDSKNPFAGFDSFSFSDLRHNGGFGLGSNLIRGEIAWDLNHTSRAPVLWLRFNPTF